MTSGPSRVVRPESIAVWDAFPVGYPAFVADVKARIATARTRAALANLHSQQRADPALLGDR